MKKYFSHQIKKELIVQDLITIETLAVSSGLCELSKYQGTDNQLDEMILMAQVVLRQYESAYHHIRFNRLRENRDSDGMLRMIEDELQTVFDLMKLRCMDSRIGYESSNHYFYTMQDLKEKIINLKYCESVLRKAF